MSDWLISVVDSLRVRGKPDGWYPSAEKLVVSGVPVEVAKRWKRERYLMTVDLKRRVKRDTN